MYICICQQVTDKQIKAAIKQGCCSLEELTDKLNVGTNCGECQHDTKLILQEALSENPSPEKV